jgi:protein disulfide-isomerase A6
MLASKPKNVVVAKVNCVAEASVCSRYSVSGYPTIKFFAKGVAEDYQGGRSVDEFIDFLNKKTSARLRVSKAPSYVTDLTPGNFDSVVNGERDVLVEFFAPWCGHCKSLAPKYELLGKAFAAETKVVIAKVDADKHRSLGERFGVSGFPTLKYFKGKTPQEFNRGSEEEMLKSVNQLAGTDRSLDGKLGEGAGRVPTLDSLAKIFIASDSAKRKLLIKQAGESKEATAQWYVKAMEKIVSSGADAAKAEKERIERIIASGATSPAQLDNFQIIRNIVAQF